jgi:hypothetical protein
MRETEPWKWAKGQVRGKRCEDGAQEENGEWEKREDGRGEEGEIKWERGQVGKEGESGLSTTTGNEPASLSSRNRATEGGDGMGESLSMMDYFSWARQEKVKSAVTQGSRGAAGELDEKSCSGWWLEWEKLWGSCTNRGSDWDWESGWVSGTWFAARDFIRTTPMTTASAGQSFEVPVQADETALRKGEGLQLHGRAPDSCSGGGVGPSSASRFSRPCLLLEWSKHLCRKLAKTRCVLIKEHGKRELCWWNDEGVPRIEGESICRVWEVGEAA